MTVDGARDRALMGLVLYDAFATAAKLSASNDFITDKTTFVK